MNDDKHSQSPTRSTVLDEWVSEDDIAHEADRTRQTIRRWLEGLKFRRLGGRRFYRRADIGYWMEHGTAPPPVLRRRRLREKVPS